MLAPDSARPATREALGKAHRLLLDYPVLVRSREREEYVLVARHVELLERWHRDHTGWPIYHDERAGVIRLRRRPSVLPSGVFEPWKSDVVLASPRDYACLVYLLWYARSPLALARGTVRQVLLSDLRDHLAQRSGLTELETPRGSPGGSAVRLHPSAGRQPQPLAGAPSARGPRRGPNPRRGDDRRRDGARGSDRVHHGRRSSHLRARPRRGARRGALRPDARSLDVPILDAELQTPSGGPGGRCSWAQRSSATTTRPPSMRSGATAAWSRTTSSASLGLRSSSRPTTPGSSAEAARRPTGPVGAQPSAAGRCPGRPAPLRRPSRGGRRRAGRRAGRGWLPDRPAGKGRGGLRRDLRGRPSRWGVGSPRSGQTPFSGRCWTCFGRPGSSAGRTPSAMSSCSRPPPSTARGRQSDESEGSDSPIGPGGVTRMGAARADQSR